MNDRQLENRRKQIDRRKQQIRLELYNATDENIKKELLNERLELSKEDTRIFKELNIRRGAI